MRRETRERWEAEASKRDDRAEAREEAVRRREDELKREEAALVSANLELQVLRSSCSTQACIWRQHQTSRARFCA